MGLFNFIGHILSGDSDKPAAEPAAEPESVEVKRSADAVDIRQMIKKSTLSLLDSLYMQDSEVCVRKHIVIWLDTDSMTFNAYSGLEQELQDYWSVERGYVFGEVLLKQGKPEGDARKVNINCDEMAIYIQEQKWMPDDGRIVKKARVMIFDNNGSMLQDAYELSSGDMEKEQIKYYNIGRGLSPQMPGTVVQRHNHIAIDDINNTEVNKYVSRAHARIGFSKNVGFYLQVELGGSRLSGNRTRILRGEKKIEVESLAVLEPLQDGDVIELGKSVMLSFNEIN